MELFRLAVAVTTSAMNARSAVGTWREEGITAKRKATCLVTAMVQRLKNAISVTTTAAYLPARVWSVAKFQTTTAVVGLRYQSMYARSVGPAAPLSAILLKMLHAKDVQKS